ncbi:MAG: hypothetical protein AB7U98_13515 [Candidatus Nitrosocosmicus sp.]
MSSELDFLKGIARALGPDVVGGPVDLAEMVVNLGRAGYGYAGHKMGLLKADQMPETLSASPGTSEWWAQKVNVPETGTGAYSAGRALPLLAGLARAGGVGAPSRGTPPSTVNQRGTIRVGGRQDLMPVHQMDKENAENLIGRGNSLEITSPSIAIMRDNIPNNFGSINLIPRVGAFDPQNSNSTLFNRDAYTSRWHDFQSRPVAKMEDFYTPSYQWDSLRPWFDDIPRLDVKNPANNPDTVAALKRLKADYANGLLDRIKESGTKSLSYFADSGVFSKEIMDDLYTLQTAVMDERVGSKHRLDPRTEAVARIADRLLDPAATRFKEGLPGGGHEIAGALSPAFKSFRQYETDPRGAAVLTPSDQVNGEAWRQEMAAVKKFRERWGIKQQDPLMMALSRKIPPIKALEAEGFSYLSPETVNPDFMREFGLLQRQFERSPSNYGELKVIGQTPVNKENWAGIVVSNPSLASDPIISQLHKATGLPIRTGSFDKDAVFSIADELQRQAGPARKHPLK